MAIQGDMMLVHPWIINGLLGLTGTALAAFSGVLLANPQDGRVTHGAATVSHDNNYTHIQQSSNQAIIEWKKFNIKNNEHTHFQLPSSQSATLNRINGKHGASKIFGKLTSNGKLFIINPAGVLFGRTAKVDVAGLMATTANIRNSDFMDSRYQFQQSSEYPNASVINYGHIRIKDKGLAALVAPGVENYGVIEAKLGKVALASGNSFTLDLYGDDLIHFTVEGDTKQDPSMTHSVRNSGRIIADGGSVQLTAETASNVVKSVINMDGYIQANTVKQVGGTIILGSSDGSANVAGILQALGDDVGEKGGKIKVLADNVNITSKATIDASGHSGGGEVLVGGNYQGQGAEHNAKTTTVGPQALIAANANHQGDGGRVIVWADDTTTFDGTIEAKAGVNGGDGGFVETSGKKILNINGLVDASASDGLPGTWLLDPTDFTVSDGLAASFSTTLDAGTSVTIKTSDTVTGSEEGDINFENTTTAISWSADADFSAYAHNDIVFSPGATIEITSTGNGDITLRADSDATDATGLSTTNGGTVTFVDATATVSSTGDGRIELFYNPISYPTADDYSNNVSADNGTFKAYMLVNTGIDLQNISDNIWHNNGSDYVIGTYALGTDLELANYDFSNGLNDADPQFVPIGKTIPFPWNTADDIEFSTAQFIGEINGDGRTISNLEISGERYEVQQNSGTLQGYQGLIWRSGPGASIYDLNLENFTVVTGGSTSFAGTLIADTRGAATIDNVHIIGGTVTGYKDIGGLTGRIFGATDGDIVSISNTSNSATVSGSDLNIGGIIGQLVGDDDHPNYGLTTTLSNVINTGSVSTNQYKVGGIIGAGSYIGSLTLNDVINTGDITATARYEGYAGGLIGTLDDTSLSDNSSTITIENSYNTGDINISSLRYGAAGIVGSFNNGSNSASLVTLKNVYNTGAVTAESYASGIFGVYVTANNDASLTITNTYNTGAITGSNDGVSGGGIFGLYQAINNNTASLTNVYSNAEIMGFSSYSGGIAGWVYSTAGGASLNVGDACFYYSNYTSAACGAGTCFGGTPLNSTQLMTLSNYIGFNDTTWGIIDTDDGGSYPYILATAEVLGGITKNHLGNASNYAVSQYSQAHIVQTDLNGDPIGALAHSGTDGAYSGILVSTIATSADIPALIEFGGGSSSTSNILYLSSNTDQISGQEQQIVLYNSSGASSSFNIAGFNTMLATIDEDSTFFGTDYQLAFEYDFPTGSDYDYQYGITSKINTYTAIGPEKDMQWVLTDSSDTTPDNLYGITDVLGFDNFASYTGGSGTNYFQYDNQTVSSIAITGNSSGTNTLAGPDADTMWAINADNIGTASDEGSNTLASFFHIQNLIGGTEADDFTLSASNLVSSIDGGTGLAGNSLTGADANTAWSITAEDAGLSDNIAFSNIQTLTGGSNSDDFTIEDGGRITTVDGGLGTNTLTGTTADDAFVLSGDNSGSITGLLDSFFSISSLDGGSNSSSNNTLTGTNSATIWAITSVNGGSLDNGMSFSNFSDLVGGIAADTFNLSNNGSVTSIDANDGADTFNLDSGSSVTGLDGGGGDATFNLYASGLVTTIDGGEGINSIVHSDVNIDSAWIIEGLNAGTLHTGSETETTTFSRVQQITASINGSNSLTSTDTSNITFEITGSDSGSITSILDAFSNIQSLTGGSGNDTFTVESTGSIDSLDGGLGADSFSLGGAGLVATSIDGGSDSESNSITRTDDTASSWALTSAYTGTMDTMDFNNIQSITAGNGTNTLTGPDADTIWTIDGANAGTVADNGSTIVTFSNMQTLTGGSNSDDFTIEDGGSITTVDGGGTETNSLTGPSTTTQWSITAANEGVVADATSTTIASFSNIQTLTGGSGTNSLTGPDADTTWTINGANAGTVADDSGTSASFFYMQNLVGGSGADTFTLDDDFVTSIDGGSATENNSITRTDDNGSAWVLDSPYAGAMDTMDFNNIQSITAGNGANTLTGPDATTTWTINGANAGTVTDDSSTSASFSNMQNLVGGSGDDSFTVEATGVMATINGGEGDDTVTLDGANLVTTIDGGGGSTNTIERTDSADSTWALTGPYAGKIDGSVSFTNISEITAYGGDGASNSLTGTNLGDEFVLDGENTGSITNLMTVFNNMGLLYGADGDDSFTINDGSFLTAGNGVGWVYGDAGYNSLLFSSDYYYPANNYTSGGYQDGVLYDQDDSSIPSLYYDNISNLSNDGSLYIEDVYMPSTLNGIQKQSAEELDPIGVKLYGEELQLCHATNSCDIDTLIIFRP